MLIARIEATEPRCAAPSCGCGAAPWDVVGPLAGIRDHQGRVDEAIALLHTRDVTSVNGRDQLADLLARQDRIEELRAYAASDSHGHAAQRLAELLEQRGDVDGAIAVYRRAAASRADTAVRLAEMLTRHGRDGEATEVLRALADEHPDDWTVDLLCTRYAAQGRAEDGLAHLDALRDRCGTEVWEIFRIRLALLAACGREAEAIELARAHPEGGTWYAAESTAELLTDAGRIEEAVAVLERQNGPRRTLARCLIELGRVGEAVALLQRQEDRPALVMSSVPDTPPF